MNPPESEKDPVKLVNLRKADYSENNANAKDHGTSTGVKNVSINRRTGSYCVSISCRGRSKYFGAFKTLKQAEGAALAGRQKMHGEFAKLT